MFAFLNVPVAGAYHLLSLLSGALHPLGGNASTALAIVVFTALVRLLLHPLSRAAVRGERARNALAPHVNALRAKHKRDPQRLNRELTKLYRESGTSALAGCLPMLLQAPVFSVLYRLFESTSIGNSTLFGVTLGQHWLPIMTGSTPLFPASIVFLALFAGLAAVATYSMRWQARQQALTPSATPPPGTKLMRLMPYTSLLMAAFVPLAAGIYLLTTNTWTAIERAALRRDRQAVAASR